MRLLLLSVGAALALLYAAAAVGVYREESRARPDTAATEVDPDAPIPRHPAASLDHLKDAYAAGNYADDLRGYLERGPRIAGASLLEGQANGARFSVWSIQPTIRSVTDSSSWTLKPIEARILQIAGN